ncbi:uncharacterized protein LOC124349024 isoform X1 [Daphnia pulicaria]|uniref:uncharacterized protein LOC124349024 isoform X1 n=1 Tax=Daphnia pulicaria TaxID=35523 RepID=UPI001EEB7AAD|nr:uncharacterized protein LOC124349024 isoform X1 [Daphnia pulicaria]
MRSSSSLSLLLLFRLCNWASGSSIIQRPDDQQQPKRIHPNQSDAAANAATDAGSTSSSSSASRWLSTWMLQEGQQAHRDTVPVIKSIKSRGFLVGDFCDDADQCNSGLPHTVCNAMTQRCECDSDFPIIVDNSICVPPLKLGEDCLYDQSCQYYDRNSVCALSDQGTAHECRCRAAFRPSITLESISQTSLCLPEPHGPWLKSDVPTVIGLGVGMSIFMALTCLVLRLFSRARFAQDQARGYGNAHLAPPSSGSTTINHTHTDGKHPPRPNYHRQVSITDSETAAPTDIGARRTNSINNGGHHHSRGSFYGRRQSNHSATYEAKSPMRNHRGETSANRESTSAQPDNTEDRTPAPLHRSDNSIRSSLD